MSAIGPKHRLAVSQPHVRSWGRSRHAVIAQPTRLTHLRHGVPPVLAPPSQLQLLRGSGTDRFTNGRWVRSVQTKTKISRCTFLLIRLSFASFLGATKGPAGALNWNSFNF